ncbi:ribokinase [Edaphobacter acidisoli]|uniref:Ribokinase n=1 Tax=Edaphobacter acidisoli TaxID=2040573 RepID=A0A916RET6_9BACT|nr:sugar kinase [Edaphobacter acidisoli]GGA55048.1 ribokinase [Edaphobacter acidisoli]
MSRFDVTLAGEITMDLVLYGLPEHLPLEQELLATSMALTLGGSSAITAHNLAALGSKVGFIPQLASDPFTELCVCTLKHAGVDLSCAVQPKPGIGTGVTVLLQHETSRRALTSSGTISALRFEDLDLDYLTSGRHFHLSSFFLQSSLQQEVPRLLRTMHEAGLTTSLDTNDDPTDRWQGPVLDTLRAVDIFMPNERELRSISGEQDFEHAVQKLAQIVPMLVIKCGSQGALVVHKGQHYTAPAVPVEVVDAVGAGDSFNSGFLHAYVHGADIPECLSFGNLTGACSTTANGGTQAFSNKQHMLDFFSKHKKTPFRSTSPSSATQSDNLTSPETIPM